MGRVDNIQRLSGRPECPHAGGMVILIRDPFELYEPAELYLQEQLSPHEVAAVTALAS
jgi:hypothetical protein